MAEGLHIGYVDVREHVSLPLNQQRLRTFPLHVLLEPGSTPLDDAWQAANPNPLLVWLATNAYDLFGSATPDLLIGASVTRITGGQQIELAILPTGLVDAEIELRINTSAFTDPADYTATPTPKRGESFVIAGVRSIAGGACAPVSFKVGVAEGTAAADPRDVTGIAIKSAFDGACDLFVGQRRQRTAVATYDDGSKGKYRRASGADGAGMLLVASLKPTTPAATPTWLHVDLTQPRSPDGPAQAVATKALAGGSAVVPVHRTYQVSWVHGTWTGTTAQPHVESGVSPPSDPIVVGTTAGAELTLPAWKDPKDLALVPGTPPEQVVAWRIYRTVGGLTEAGGDAYLVAEVPAKKTTTGQTVPAKTWTDTSPDTTLTTPLLSELKVDFRHTSDSKGTKLLDGFANLDGVLDQSSYQEADDGTPAFTGQRIEIHLQGAPGGALVGYTTRPTAGGPRVTWASRSPAGDTGVGSGQVTITPTGVAATTDSTIDALVSSVPARFGALWSQRGTDRVRIEVGSETDTGQPLANGIGMVAGQSAQILPGPTVPSARAIDVDTTAEALAFTARGLRRLRLLFDLPRPTGAQHAVDGDGAVAEVALDPSPANRPRSLRVRRDTVGNDGTSRLVVRAGDLPDAIALDLRPGNPFPEHDETPTPLTGTIDGRIRRVAVLSQAPADLAPGSPADGRRRDGVNVAIPDTGGRLDLSVDSEQAIIGPSGNLRVRASLRSTAGLGTKRPVHLVQASVSTVAPVTVTLPQGDGRFAVVADSGVSGRMALSARGLTPTDADRLLAARATPQALVALRRTVQPPDPAKPGSKPTDGRVLDDVTLRWLGITEVNKPADAIGPRYRGGLGAARTNKAFRTRVFLTDDRMKPATWEMVRGRVADLPESIRVVADTDHNSYSVDFNRRSGQTILFAQPPLTPTTGVYAGGLVGVGLAAAVIDSLPAGLQVDLLGGSNPLPSVPFNDVPNHAWRRSGFRILAGDELVIRSLNVASVSHVRPNTYASGANGLPWNGDIVAPTAFWTWTAASIIRIHSGNGQPPNALWLWTPAEPLPSPTSSDYTSESAWKPANIDSWLGFKIEEPTLVDLQVQPYRGSTTTIPAWWNDVFLGWLLNVELQMKDYRGEVTVDGAFPEGTIDSGIGKWTLRVPDGFLTGLFNGQFVFGNTGGTPSNRPRVYPSFIPNPTKQPTF